MNKIVDVIIPVYRPGKEFWELLERLLQQTTKIHKIILMNNGKIIKIGKKSEVMSDLDFDNSCPVIGGYRNE